MAGPETSLRMALARAIALPLSFISPAAAGRYLAGHARLAAGLIGYDAARRDGPNGRWLPRDDKADPMLARDARIIRARARAMARDNGNISGALRKIVANVVYSGLTPQAQHRDATGARDCAACGALENDWKDWAEENDIWLIQQLALRHLWLDGGFFLHFYAVPRFQKDGLVPLGVELLDMDALDMSVHGPQPNGNIARYGAEYDSRGNLLAWHILEESLYGGVLDEGWTRDPAVHPAFGAGRTLRLKAEDCRLVMQPDRIGQTLPVSWMHAVIMGMHNFDEYQTSEQIAARLAAAFAIFLKDSGEFGAGSMGNSLSGAPLNPAPLAGGQTTAGRALSMDTFISSGRIDELPPGKEIQIVENRRPANNYTDYTKTSLRGASSGMAMSYESFGNDYSDASYSAARQAVLEERRGYRMQQIFLARKLMTPIWRRFVMWRKAFGLGPEERVPVVWQMPGWSWVDPVKDANAAQTRVKLGIISRRELCAEEGRDFGETVTALAEEKQMLEEAGLSADVDGGSGEIIQEDDNEENRGSR